jgi:2-polyprenyl-3-methyl-5-hydroxy-6-metoxy-1,4-benzoquinol methylase
MSPSPFIVEWIERIARERGPSTRLGAGADLRALDVAMGRGRHALPLARAGFRTFGVDVDLEAVARRSPRDGAKACASKAGART